MSARIVTLHVFCSAKGGVGKSTLAVVCATLLARDGRRCVLVDADLTGTSLADGLDLCAPVVATGPDGKPDFFAPATGRFLCREDTVGLRNERRDLEWEDRPPGPPYLNDILIRGERDKECRVEALMWKNARGVDGPGFLPSSPLPQDISIALGWLRGEPFDWLQRFMWLLDGMRAQMPALSDVVVDLPPGLVGFAHEILALLSNLDLKKPFPSGFPQWNPEEWKGRPFIVTTEDRNDFILAVEYWMKHSQRLRRLERLTVLLNRATQGERWLAEEVSRHFGKLIKLEEVPLVRVEELAPLRELFISGKLPASEDVQRIRERLMGGEHAFS